ncbi:MAG TPA: hydroxymethylglutaryl-CoA reductase, degradative [Candidatus Bathyarchaeia archaeon]|nr:hydroxymethylglutaryl-CoA reductase, degradative [Candidatus Bathyarchaeia archaeon]
MTDDNSTNKESIPSFSGFYKLTSEERLKKIQQYIPELTNEDISILLNTGSLDLDTTNRMVENAVGTIAVPFGLAVNFIINEKIYSVPMAIEEPSVIAASCNSAKLTLATGGFKASTTEQIMIGQIQILDLINHQEAVETILANKEQILEIANRSGKTMVALGGGAKDVRAKIIETRVGKMVICELLIDCLDAMGANAVSSMAEIVSPFIEEITGGRVLLRILSNLTDLRLAKASCVILKDQLGGDDIVDNIVAAAAFAETDPYRAATHNKGVMNGISAVILATANDTRAIEAGAHAYAAKDGHYGSLTKWTKNENGDLIGSIEIPLAVGIIGGATKTNPVAQIALKIMRIKSASELAQVAVSVGLAQNLGALRALATTGIIKGHMKLHSKNIAVAAGAVEDEIEIIAQKMIDENKVKYSRAVELLTEMKKK